MNTDDTLSGLEAPSAKRRTSPNLAAKVASLLGDRDGQLPVWVRCPKAGPEHYSGIRRSKLYELAGKNKIRSVSIREPGQVRGTRLFHLGSILEFVARCETSANAATTTATPPTSEN